MNFNIYEKYNNVQNLMHYDMIIDRVKKKTDKKQGSSNSLPPNYSTKGDRKKNNYNVLKNVCR